jgi:hypothetical protein
MAGRKEPGRKLARDGRYLPSRGATSFRLARAKGLRPQRNNDGDRPPGATNVRRTATRATAFLLTGRLSLPTSRSLPDRRVPVTPVRQ